ncbi:uncharacterized protein LOC135469181 isoform X2 [Liolophura sinensis]
MECCSDVPDTMTKMSTQESVAIRVQGTEGDGLDVCPAKRRRLDPSDSAAPTHQEGNSLDVNGNEPTRMSRMDLYYLHKAKEVKEIKKLFQENGFLPVPDSTDLTFLTTELKRRQHCQKHGIKHDIRLMDMGGNSGIQASSGHQSLGNQPANARTSKRHSQPSSEDHDVPRKVRVIQQGRQ